MSRNNLIGVCKFHGRYYILKDLNADTEWNFAAAERIIRATRVPSRKRRLYALLHAHNLQNRMLTEYGVREISE